MNYEKGNLGQNSNLVSRQSGIELLRILTICGVILLHYNDGKAFVWVDEQSVNQYVLMLVESVCICAVDLFMIISGYFLSASQKRQAIKPLELIFQVVLFNVLLCLLKGNKNQLFAIKSLVCILLPANYFVILYIVVYIVSPWINLLINKLDDKSCKRLLGTLVALFAVCPTLADLLQEILGQEFMGINTVGAWGDQQGFTIVNFLLCYIIGTYLNRSGKDYKRTPLLIVYIGVCILIFGWSILCDGLTLFGLRSAWEYCNPFVILQAVLLFLIFKQFTFKSKMINYFAKSAFICFLLHSYFMKYIKIELFVHKAAWIMLLHMLLSAVGIYILCWLVWLLYYICSKKTVKKIGIWLCKKGLDFSVDIVQKD